jgi:hypothetical protein
MNSAGSGASPARFCSSRISFRAGALLAKAAEEGIVLAPLKTPRGDFAAVDFGRKGQPKIRSIRHF